MESAEELQQNEIIALKSIYGEDYIQVQPSKAWPGAPRLPQFIIRVLHPNPHYAERINFKLHITFPKTYPRIQQLIYNIAEAVGLDEDDLEKLAVIQRQVVKATRGSEAVMELVNASQEWMEANAKQPIEAFGSLALQMKQRAEEEAKARRKKAEEGHLLEIEEAKKLAEELRLAEEQLDLQMKLERKVRRRALSDATTLVGDTLTEHFGEEIEMDGITFNSVKYYHPRNECLGMSYAADPICDDISASLPLELHVVTFDSPYYSSSQGKKKLKQIEDEVRSLISIRHDNVVRILAVKLTMYKMGNSSQLFILSEKPPSHTLHDVLQDCDSLRDDRVSDYLGQILSGLHAIHAIEMIHRGLNTRVIGLDSRPSPSGSKRIKIFKVAYYTGLLDLHKSNPFRPQLESIPDVSPIPDAWLSKDVSESSLLYTRSRDIHDVGIILMQMLLGLDVLYRFSDIHTAITSSSVSPSLQRHALSMLLPPKRNNVTCLSLLADLSSTTMQMPVRNMFTQTPGPPTPTPAMQISSSPEIEYFRPAMAARQVSRWKEDWEELELLGKGAFGSVVKARNKIDGRIYAVKMIRLRTVKSDARIFREVNALSRLSHRFIVRYYTTWVETSEQHFNSHLDDSDDDSEFDDDESTTDGRRSIPSREVTMSVDDSMLFNLDDLDAAEPTSARGSFPSIHFGRSTDSRVEEDTDSGSDGDIDQAMENLLGPATPMAHTPMFPTPIIQRTLYIQMEFVERQTLRERIDEGLSEQEAWRLFTQIVDALAHMSTLGILHRDLKPANLFIDGNDNCKVGDFGLATSSLAAVDPSDMSSRMTIFNPEMTFDVGTRLYIAPEVQKRKRAPTDHSKADMYSLGIVFFEMNFAFSTASERIFVLENLRKPEIVFPPTWNANLSRQKQIIELLLQHDPNDRPTAQELSQSPLLPPKVEDEYFKGALNLMTKPDSPHHQAVIASLFGQPQRLTRSFMYDSQVSEILPVYQVVHERLASLFKLRGAVDTEPPLLLPVTSENTDNTLATFIDRHGDLVALSNNLLVPFARLAARLGTKRIKRFHIGDVYRGLTTASGHPKTRKVAIFDIITPDLSTGPVASAAEMLAIANDLLKNFPGLSHSFSIHISHSDIVDPALRRIPEDKRSFVVDMILQSSKSSPMQRRNDLLKRQLPRSIVDELEVLYDMDDNIDELMFRLERANVSLATKMQPAVEDIKATIRHASFLGVKIPIVFRPLMLESYKQGLYSGGVLIEIVRKTKRNDVLAVGGRYDHLISRFSAPKLKLASLEPSIFAFGMQMSVDKIVWALDSYQSSQYQSLLMEKQTFGFWSSRRCDVYVISYQEGYLQDRLEIVSHLWQHGISADLMYESGIQTANAQDVHEQCLREGILFSVYPRPRRDQSIQSAYKVKSILKGTEYDVSKQELVPWLQQQIAEQKRNDLPSGEAPLFAHEAEQSIVTPHINHSDMQLVLPKQRKHLKTLLMDRAYDSITEFKAAFSRNPNATPHWSVGIFTIVIDVSPTLFDALTRSGTWVTDDDLFKSLQGEFVTPVYGQQVRDAVAKKRKEGHTWILFFAVKEERIGVLRI